jgi:TonB family protein
VNKIRTYERGFRYLSFLLTLLLFVGGAAIFRWLDDHLAPEEPSAASPAAAVTLDFFQMEMVAEVRESVPEKKEPEPLPPPEEVDVALEEIVEEPEPEVEPEEELILEPVDSDAQVNQDAIFVEEVAVDFDALQVWAMEQVELVKYYPPSAQRIGLEGTYEILVTVGSDGVILSAEVMDGKGHLFLRRALEKMMKRLPGRGWGQPVGESVDIPIEFSFDLD